MDCGCYECSAVTAGGVRNASVLSESFSLYSKDLDVKEFKKSQFEGKEIAEHITLMPYTAKPNKEEVPMGDIAQDKELLSKNYELVAEKAKIEVKLATLEGEFNLLKTTSEAVAKQLETTQAEFAQSKIDLAGALASVEEFTKKTADLEAAAEALKVEYEAKIADAETKVANAAAFKAAYIAIVEADGVKIAREADYASKSLEELQALHTEYLAEIAKLPSGQQTSIDDAGTQVVSGAYVGIPEDLFKTGR
jgi:chromosome segregation ATPase